MIKTFFKNSFIYTFSSIITRGIGIFMMPIYTRIFTPNDYGIIDFVMVVSSLIGLTVALEISQSIPRFVATEKDLNTKQIYASTIFFFTFVMYSLFFLSIIVFNDNIRNLIFEDQINHNTFIVAMASISMSGLLIFFNVLMQAELKAIQSAITSVVGIVLMVTLTIIFVVYMRLGIIGMFYAQLMSKLVSVLISYLFMKELLTLQFDFNKLKNMLHFSWPLIPSSIAVFIALYIDRIAIKELLGFTEVGLYGVAYRMASISSLVMVGFQGALMPLVYQHYTEKRTSQDVATIFKYFSAFMLLVILGSFLFSKEALFLLTTEKYYMAYNLIPILVMSVFLSSMYIFAPGLGIAKKTKIIALISIFIAILNFILTFSLIPLIGIMGAAIGTFTSALFGFFIYVYYGQKYYYIPYEKILITKNFMLFTGLGILVMFFLSNVNYLNTTIKVFIFIAAIYYLNIQYFTKEQRVNIYKKIKAVGHK